MSEFSFDADVRPIVERLARATFVRRPDRETMILDAVSVAWEFAQAASPEATPKSLAWYAVQRVGIERQFPESTRSIDRHFTRERERTGREWIDLGAISREGDDPAEIVAFRLDFRAWLETLTDRQRAMAFALALGDATQDVAEFFGCTAGNVSQFRRKLLESWQEFRE